MPLFTVTMKAGRAADEKNAISRAIHEASVKAGYRLIMRQSWSQPHARWSYGPEGEVLV